MKRNVDSPSHDAVIPDPNWFRSRGVDPTFLIMYEHKGGLTPSLFAKNVWELGGGNPSK